MPSFSLPTAPMLVIEAQDPTVLGGADISLVGGDFGITSHGDWAVVAGVDAAKQSIVREIPAMPGSFPRRQTWGAGAAGMVFKGATKDAKDRLVTLSTAAIHRNPRVKKTNEISAQTSENGQGLSLTIRVDSVDGPITTTLGVK